MSGYSDIERDMRWANGYVSAWRNDLPFDFDFEDAQRERDANKKRITKKKQPDNEFKVRWRFRNNLNYQTFKITKKFWIDIEWCYKVKYIDSGSERIFTESHFRSLLNRSRFRRINPKVGDKKEHFDDNELFNI